MSLNDADGTNVLSSEEAPEVVEDLAADRHVLEHSLQLGRVLVPALNLHPIGTRGFH